MDNKRTPWTNDELLVVFRLYCRTPFGKLHQRNPDILDISKLLGRSPSAVGMKACNFASLDPAQRSRKVAGLGNVSKADRDLWERFENDSEGVAAEAEAVYARLSGRDLASDEWDFGITLPLGPTEVTRSVRTRCVQSFFRAAVLTSYEYRCALTGLAVPELLNASHIIPWKTDAKRRADPRNGIALNVLYDRAFDRGLITFDTSLRVMLSERLVCACPSAFQSQILCQLKGRQLQLPPRFAPDPVAIAYHRENIFLKE